MPAPTNPYRRPLAAGTDGDRGGFWRREHERVLGEAEGLSLARLDRAVRESQIAAAQEATMIAEAKAEQRFERLLDEVRPNIYDEGFDAGAAHVVGLVLNRAASIERELSETVLAGNTARLGKARRDALEHVAALAAQIVDRCREVQGG